MISVRLDPAFVLHKRPYRETSELVELFTFSAGRIGCIARGASRKRRGGALSQRLQLFRPILVAVQGQSDLKTLTQVEDVALAHYLSGDGFYAACYVNELLLRVLQPEDAYPEVFAAYADLLPHFGSPNEWPWRLRRFEWQLIKALGGGFDLSLDSESGEQVQPGFYYVFRKDQGWVGSSEFDQSAVSGQWIRDFSEDSPAAWRSREAKELCRALLYTFAGDKPFRSRELWRQSRSGGQ